MNRMAGAVLSVFAGVASAQIGAVPHERLILPTQTLDPPLFAAEIDVVTDAAAALLKGSIDSVELKSYFFDEGGQRQPEAESTMRISYDSCGNITSMESGSEWDGEYESEGVVRFENIYSNESCQRGSAKLTFHGGDRAAPIDCTFTYDGAGRLVEADYGAAALSIRRIAEVVESATRRDARAGEIEFTFDTESSRVIRIEDRGGQYSIDWADDRTFQITGAGFGDEPLEVTLDDHGSIAVVTMPEGAAQMFGHQLLRRYEYDEQGNWTARTEFSVDAPGAGPKPYEYIARTIRYRAATDDGD